MNRYHQNHPDPEIRAKYEAWKAAVDARDKRIGKKVVKVKITPSHKDLIAAIGARVAFNKATDHLSDDSKELLKKQIIEEHEKRNGDAI